MKTKEEIIREAWESIDVNILMGVCMNTGFVTSYCDNGIDDILEYHNLKIEDLDINSDVHGIISYRPNFLQGIETNNGWTKIESEADIPKNGEYDMSSFKLIYWTNNGLYYSEDYKRHKLHYDYLEITHYQLLPINKPLPPIF